MKKREKTGDYRAEVGYQQGYNSKISDLEKFREFAEANGSLTQKEMAEKWSEKISARTIGKALEEETELLKLPGIGKYTARAICSQAFGQSKVVLDTNVARILERFFGIKGGRVKSRCKILWNAAETLAPDREVGYWNLTLLDEGSDHLYC